MIPRIPWYITLVVIVTDVAAAVAVWSILSWAAGRSGLVPAAQRRFRIGSAVFFGAWLGAALLFAPAPSSLLTRDPFSVTPVILLLFAAWRCGRSRCSPLEREPPPVWSPRRWCGDCSSRRWG